MTNETGAEHRAPSAERGKKESGFRKLRIWEKGIEITKLTYQITRKFPEEEKFGLVSQMRRSAVSIPSNIAEGYSRKNDKEFKQFLYIALGSLGELETQLTLATGMGWIRNEVTLCDAIHHERSMILKICRPN